MHAPALGPVAPHAVATYSDMSVVAVSVTT